MQRSVVSARPGMAALKWLIKLATCSSRKPRQTQRVDGISGVNSRLIRLARSSISESATRPCKAAA